MHLQFNSNIVRIENNLSNANTEGEKNKSAQDHYSLLFIKY